MTIETYQIEACRHVGQNPNHPPHMCPDPIEVDRWRDPEFRVPPRPEQAGLINLPPEVKLRHWTADDPPLPTSARALLTCKSVMVWYALGYPSAGEHLTGECPTCRERHKITKNGGLRSHGGTRWVCEGSGRPSMQGRCPACQKVGMRADGSTRSHGGVADYCIGSGDLPTIGSTRHEPQSLWLLTGPDWVASWVKSAFSMAFIKGRYATLARLRKHAMRD